MGYPKINEFRTKNGIKKVNKKDIGKQITIPGQAMSLKEIIKRSISGFPVPMQREELQLHPDINQVLQGTNMDIVSDAKFAKMTKTERAMYLNNVRGLKQQLAERLQEAIQQKEAVEASLTSTTTGTVDPPAKPEPSN